MPSDVFFTSNPAEFTKLEGLYVSEKDPPGFIRGRDLSIVGFAGKCVRGPLTPQTITSTARFLEIYGGRDFGSGGALYGEVWKALLNKPFGTVVVRRVAAAAATKATKTLPNVTPADIIRVDASSVGAWAATMTVSVEAASNADATAFNLRIKFLGKEYLYENLNVTGSADNLAEVIGDDPGTLITATKLAAGRPLNVADAAFTTGVDGTLATSDYISGLTDLVSTDGVAVILVPESLEDTVTTGAQATFNASVVTQAPTVSDRIFLVWSGKPSNSDSAEISAKTTQITTASDRIVWCYNAPKTLDPTTALKIETGPHVWMASILSQNDVDVHPGSQGTSKQTAGITSLHFEQLTRAALIGLRAAGIATLEKLSGKFLFRSAVCTDLTTGKTEITRRRSTDFLQLSASDRLRNYVKEKNSVEKRAQLAGELIAFSQGLKDQARIIESFAVEQDSVNTPTQRGQGIEKLFWRVRLIGHILFLVLETEIGTGVVIEAAAA
jgi:hypothetical protein